MIIFPAIDLLDGNCVRLYQGDYNSAHKVAKDPLVQAKCFEEEGASWLHMVDLNGAKDGKTVNHAVICEITSKTKLKVEVGGGIRNMETAEKYLTKGVSRVILGSAALQKPEFVKEAVRAYGDKVAVGIDCKNGFVSVSGWMEKTETTYLDFAKQMEDVGVRYLIVTDIAKDGMLEGPNFEMLKALSDTVSCHITASGGVHSLDDIRRLKEMNLYGAIAGKALYTGALSLKEAVMLSTEE